MVEYSGPLIDRNFTDETWRGIFGGTPAIVNDTTGTAYMLTLPPDSNTALVGAPEQDSDSIVGGFLHRISAGDTHPVEIPPSTNAAVGRTDVIGVEYDPTRITEPGPCRLTRLPGVEGSTVVPTYTGLGEFMRLYEFPRKAGQSLNQALPYVRDARRRQGPSLVLRADQARPPSPAIGTRVQIGDASWLRTLDASGTPTWRQSDIMPRNPGEFVIAGYSSATTNQNGDALFTLPGGGFPHALSWVMFSDANASMEYGQITFRWNVAASSRSAVNYRAYGGTGKLPNFVAQCVILAGGW